MAGEAIIPAERGCECSFAQDQLSREGLAHPLNNHIARHITRHSSDLCQDFLPSRAGIYVHQLDWRGAMQ